MENAVNFIELQFDDFTLESFDRFWYEVDRLDDKNVVLLLDPEAATVTAESIDRIKKSKVPAGVRLSSFNKMKEWEEVAQRIPTEKEYELFIAEEARQIFRSLNAQKPEGVNVLAERITRF